MVVASNNEGCDLLTHFHARTIDRTIDAALVEASRPLETFQTSNALTRMHIDAV